MTTAVQLVFDGMAPSAKARVVLTEAPGDSLPFHPLADLFPLLAGTEFDALVADIRTHGLLEPVWLYHGQLLDGRNRYLACRQLGIPCASRISDGNDPVEFVLSTNRRRRHLDESQRAMIAAKLATLGQGVRADRVDAQIQASATQEHASELLNVSRTAVQTARKVQHDGAPEVIKAVEAGEIKVSAAQEFITLPHADQVAALEDVRHAAEGKPLTAPRVRTAVQARMKPVETNYAVFFRQQEERRRKEACKSIEKSIRGIYDNVKILTAATAAELSQFVGTLSPSEHKDTYMTVDIALIGLRRVQALLQPPPDAIPAPVGILDPWGTTLDHQDAELDRWLQAAPPVFMPAVGQALGDVLDSAPFPPPSSHDERKAALGARVKAMRAEAMSFQKIANHLNFAQIHDNELRPEQSEQPRSQSFGKWVRWIEHDL